MDFTVGIALRNLDSTSNFVKFGDSRSLPFFETSRFGCLKMTFDSTKVTCNTYSCAISGMSREMMEMDGRDSAKCQNWGNKGHIWY